MLTNWDTIQNSIKRLKIEDILDNKLILALKASVKIRKFRTKA